MPIKWKSKILLCKRETVYGVDAAPTGTVDGILATSVVLSPMEGQDVSREHELPWLGAQATVPTQLAMRLQYRVEMVPSGTAGVPPAWGTSLRACAVGQTITAATSVVYNPISDGHESVTHHFWIGPTRFVLKGSRGSAVMRIDAQGIPYLEFDFRGLFSLPSDPGVRPTVDLTAFLAPDIATSLNTPVFTLGAVPLVLRNFSLDLGNDVQGRFLIGAESILVVDRTDAISCQVEAVPLSTFDPFAAAAGQLRTALSLQHGRSAGRKATLAVAGAQLQRPSFANQQNILEWVLPMVPLTTAGNDQWTLTLT